MKATWDENPVAWFWQWGVHPGMWVCLWAFLAWDSWLHQKFDVFGFVMFVLGVTVEKVLGERKGT